VTLGTLEREAMHFMVHEKRLQSQLSGSRRQQACVISSPNKSKVSLKIERPKQRQFCVQNVSR
jgi:hypothetical protein